MIHPIYKLANQTIIQVFYPMHTLILFFLRQTHQFRLDFFIPTNHHIQSKYIAGLIDSIVQLKEKKSPFVLLMIIFYSL